MSAPHALSVDKVDLKLLGAIEAEGGRFMKHPSHEHRAYELERKGLLKRANVIYRQTPSTVEFRWKYFITKEGRALLRVGTGEKA